jgi:hypothetical protein
VWEIASHYSTKNKITVKKKRSKALKTNHLTENNWKTALERNALYDG